jgi:tRNA(adenine34) deaminase
MVPDIDPQQPCALDRRLARRQALRAMTRPQTAQKPDYMSEALAEAALAAAAGEVPVGAVLVDAASGEILARAHNRVERDADPTAHAELLAIRAAAAGSGLKRLTGADIYVTLEPCPMCAQAIAFARLRRVVFGAYDPKGGGVDHGARIFQQPTCHHRPEVVGGVQEQGCAALLRDFFQARRG